MKKNSIILIGFMAGGKSVAAKKLAKKLKMPMLDTDTLIENREGIKIKDIFRIHGEPYFRNLEKETVKRIFRLKDMIVSTGGGIILNAGNRRILRKCGTVFYLKTSSDVILRRIKKTKDNKRPLLADKTDLKSEIKRLLKFREPYYCACAHHVIDTSDMTEKEVVGKIAGIMSEEWKC
jgi:shikimate kinase